MSVSNLFVTKAYGQNQPLIVVNPAPIPAQRAPLTTDRAPIGSQWDWSSQSRIWFLASVIAGISTWVELATGSSAGVFTSLTVTPGPINLTGVLTQVGTANINATGTADTNIGNSTGALTLVGPTSLTGTFTQVGTTNINSTGTAVTNIGNTTGNTAVTGALVASGALRGATVYSSGDLGGVASQNALSNVSVPVAGGSGSFTITSATGAGTATNAGFIKMYVGATAVFIPYYTATA